MSKKCRLWWPENLSKVDTPTSVFLFGWIVSSSSDSVDIVVAFACSEATFLSIQSDFQGILNEISRQMPESLQDKCTLSLLGHCAIDLAGRPRLPTACNEEYNQMNSTHGNLLFQRNQDVSGEKDTWWNCERCTVDRLFDISKMFSVERNNWIQLVYKNHGSIDGKIKSIPTLRHMYGRGMILSKINLQVILYETPIYGSHHFSLEFFSSEQRKALKAPMWLEALHQNQLFLDLETVILAINSAYAAKSCFERTVGPKRVNRFPILFMCVTLTRQLLAVFIASLSTLIYTILQVLHVILSYGSKSWMYPTLGKLFSNTWKTLESVVVRFYTGQPSLEILYSEYAEKAATHRHSMWSSIATDVLLGNILGTALYSHAESVSVWISKLIDDITNNLLRSGCVWLMGVPAGFKLNTELAGVLGMIYLNAIQVWSTLWFFLGPPVIYLVKGLAISAIIFGLTTPAAFIMDTISLATLHVTVLHWLISRLYSLQIQAITALWRLFRGRKSNPLRHRHDSYDYSVEHHIVGSLLFTPILLLLPTTSVFYIFFTIMKSTINFTCIAIEAVVSLIHATPYLKIFIWLMRPKRFPSGIWFDIKVYRSNSETTCQSMNTNKSQSSSLILFLRSNNLNLRGIVSLHYKHYFSVVSSSFLALTVRGILIGKSIPSTLRIGLPATMPWMFIPYIEYWHLCRDSILGCPKNGSHNAFQKTRNT